MDASQFVKSVIDDEKTALEAGHNDYSKERVDMAIVHTRTDMVQVVYELIQIKQILKYILYILIAGLILLWSRGWGSR